MLLNKKKIYIQNQLRTYIFVGLYYNYLNYFFKHSNFFVNSKLFLKICTIMQTLINEYFNVGDVIKNKNAIIL